MKTVIVIDDYTPIFELFEICLEGVAQVITAKNFQEARNIIEDEEIDVTKVEIIALDGCLESTHLDTIELITPLHKKFPLAKIIAISVKPEISQEMVKQGCEELIPKGDSFIKIKKMIEKEGEINSLPN